MKVLKFILGYALFLDRFGLLCVLFTLWNPPVSDLAHEHPYLIYVVGTLMLVLAGASECIWSMLLMYMKMIHAFRLSMMLVCIGFLLYGSNTHLVINMIGLLFISLFRVKPPVNWLLYTVTTRTAQHSNGSDERESGRAEEEKERGGGGGGGINGPEDVRSALVQPHHSMGETAALRSHSRINITSRHAATVAAVLIGVGAQVTQQKEMTSFVTVAVPFLYLIGIVLSCLSYCNWRGGGGATDECQPWPPRSLHFLHSPRQTGCCFCCCLSYKRRDPTDSSNRFNNSSSSNNGRTPVYTIDNDDEAAATGLSEEPDNQQQQRLAAAIVNNDSESPLSHTPTPKEKEKEEANRQVQTAAREDREDEQYLSHVIWKTFACESSLLVAQSVLFHLFENYTLFHLYELATDNGTWLTFQSVFMFVGLEIFIILLFLFVPLRVDTSSLRGGSLWIAVFAVIYTVVDKTHAANFSSTAWRFVWLGAMLLGTVSFSEWAYIQTMDAAIKVGYAAEFQTVREWAFMSWTTDLASLLLFVFGMDAYVFAAFAFLILLCAGLLRYRYRVSVLSRQEIAQRYTTDLGDYPPTAMTTSVVPVIPLQLAPLPQPPPQNTVAVVVSAASSSSSVSGDVFDGISSTVTTAAAASSSSSKEEKETDKPVFSVDEQEVAAISGVNHHHTNPTAAALSDAVTTITIPIIIPPMGDTASAATTITTTTNTVSPAPPSSST